MQLAGERRTGGSPPWSLVGNWETWIHFRCRLGFPAEQSQESHGGEERRLPNRQHSPVFVLCLQYLLTTASLLQLLLVALACALAGETPTQEKVVATASRGLCQPISCELLWFECGFVNTFPSRRFGRCSSLHFWEVKILMVNFEKLV